MSVADVLARIRAALDRAGIDFMLSGSFASALYGVPRSTQDIDLVIAASPEQLRKFVHSLPTDEYYVDLDAALEAHRRQSLFNVVDNRTGWKIDLIIRKPRAFSQMEFSRRISVQVHEIPLFVASPEDVVISKLEWSKLAGSQRQVEDVAAILRARRDSLDRSYIRKWVAELDIEAAWKNAQITANVFLDSI